MILNQQLFDVKIINETNGDLIMYIPPQQVTSLKFEKVINGIGSFVATFPYNQTIWDAYKVDRLIEVSTINYETLLLEKEETFFLRKQEVYYEGDFKQIAFSGVGLEDLIRRRAVKPTTSDMTNAGGFVTRGGTAGDVLKGFVDEQIISPDDTERAFSNITVTKVSDGNDVGIRTRYKNLLDVFDQIRVNGNVDYKITRTSDNDLEIKIGSLGNDLTYTTNYPNSDFLLFSPNLGNAFNPLFNLDAKAQQNYIYVLGEGEGSNQNILEIAGVGISSSIYNRVEDAVESRKGEGSLGSANQQALTTGLKKLNSSRVRTEYSFDIVENRLGFRYRQDWDIGDIATFSWEGILVDFEIKSTTFTVSGNKADRELTLNLREG
jgi:hypothetical protein